MLTRLTALSLTVLGALFGDPQPQAPAGAKPAPGEAKPASGGQLEPEALVDVKPAAADVGPKPAIGELLPIDLTAFGDIFYALEPTEPDAFHIGSLEIDIALKLVPFVTAFGGVAYDADEGAMKLASFTVDCGLWGKDEHAFWPSRVFDASGLLIGKFDVPFGVAYLQYGAPNNRLVTLPGAVRATHDGWNDLGAQFYGSVSLANLVAYLVNGSGLPMAEAASAHKAIGGRLGLKPLGVWEPERSFELGGSLARTVGAGSNPLMLWGADISVAAAGAELKNELIVLDPAEGPSIRGFYTQLMYTVDPLFLAARYGSTFEANVIRERPVTLSAGVEIIPQGEVRLMYQRDLEVGGTMLLVQIAAGSQWQPTGLRR